jgi:hypothetical protein
VELTVDNKPPVLIFDKDEDGRISSFNIGEVLKKIRDAE